MKQLISFSGVMEAVNHSKNRAMEADTISKHGRSLKSHTSRGNIFRKMCFGLLTAGIIALSINACTGATAQSGRGQPERWEYHRVWMDGRHYQFDNMDGWNGQWIEGFPQIIRQLGAEGWELTTTGGSNGNVLYFKRRLP